MKYIHIPVEFEAPTDDDFARFCAAMESIGNDKVHVHCIVNARVSAFIYRYRRDCLNMNEKQARDIMEKIWRPGGVWAEFIGDKASIDLPHRPARKSA
ncbi:hypothetical protein [Lichenicoccus sp.]|uniref:hypothetical protein n=1 Tax=Lichenicoccus sp. TaxID=2781899 RepID=UPI003D0CC1E2